MTLRQRFGHLKQALGLNGTGQTPRTKAVIPYEGAGTGRRALGWNFSSAGPNSTITGNAKTLRARTRQLVRNNGWASNALDTFVAEVIGTGIKPVSKHPDEVIRGALHEAWYRWTDEADADGVQDFYGVQALAARAEMEAGECFGRMRFRFASDALSVPFQIQLLEADFVPDTKNELLTDRRRIRAGIELDNLNRRKAYYLYPEHPGDTVFGFGQRPAGDFIRVPASEMLHVFRPLRPGQLRGQPRFTPVIVKLLELSSYDDAVVVLQKLAALFSGFINKNSDSDNPLPTESLNTKSTTGPDGEIQQVLEGIIGLEPGVLNVLLPGWSITFSDPPEAGASYETFMKVQLRAVAAALGMTYEQFTNDLSTANYSSIRAGLLQFRRKAETYQHNVIAFQFCRPIWREWVPMAITAGAVAAKGVTQRQILSAYNQNPEQFLAVEWRPPSWPWVDPVKDVQAAKMARRAGFASTRGIIAELGYDIEEVWPEIEAENAEADRRELIFDSDPRHTDAKGGTGKTQRVDAANTMAARIGRQSEGAGQIQ